MKSIIKNKFNIEKYILMIIMIVLIGLPSLKLLSYILYTSGILYDSFQINQVYLLWLMIPFLFIVYILDIIINNKKINYVDIIIYFLIILSIVSTIFAVNRNISIYGEYKRNEGLLSIISYYLIFLNLKNINNKKYVNIIIKTIVTVGIVQVIYAILQVYTQFNFIKHYSRPYMASSLSGNPNFFGGYMVMHTLIMFVLYIFKEKKIYLYLSVLFFIGLCLASSTGPFLGLIITIIFFTIFYRKKIDFKKLFKILFIYLITFIVIDLSVKFVQENIFKNSIEDNYNITRELKKKGGTNGFGNGRLELWKNSLPLINKYWLTGAGLDNFGKIYGVRNGLYFDKAHNVYLQMIITNGLFALILYLVLCLICCLKNLKLKDELYISLFIAFVGYSIQAFANISVIDVAPTFFTIFGLLMAKLKQ